MKIEDAILSVAAKKKVFKTADVVKQRSDLTPEYISSKVKSLVDSGVLVKEGSGRWSTYALPENSDLLGHRIRRRFKRQGLVEHEVLDEIMSVSNALKRVPENVKSIFNYAFSEMLNNAIEHSESEAVEIDVFEENKKIKFVVKDAGIGVFNSVREKKHLNTDLEAIQELMKGKTTTAPQAHSGEGIFFTSKIADVFKLDSFSLRLRVDNKVQDIFVLELPRKIKGTAVSFEISTNTPKHLNDLFAEYQTDQDEPAFDKTLIRIKLYTMGTIYVSRSQARRILVNLDKFRTVVLDFDKVPTIGQAFADEIFRVFQNRFPDINIQPINMNEAVAFMIQRAKADQPR